jgi:hypothetical protein
MLHVGKRNTREAIQLSGGNDEDVVEKQHFIDNCACASDCCRVREKLDRSDYRSSDISAASFAINTYSFLTTKRHHKRRSSTRFLSFLLP